MKHMKVLIVSRGLPQPDNPTFGIFELDQAKALAENGADVVFFAIDLRSIRRKRKFGITTELRDGIRCYTISVPLGNVPIQLFCNIGSQALMRLYTHVFSREVEPDVIHAHFYRQGYMAAKLSQKVGIPLVITEHSSDMTKNIIDKNILKIAKMGYAQAKTVITVGNDLSKSLLNNMRTKSVIIPNVVDTALFSVAENIKYDGFHFISVARFAPQKRQDLLIEAFSQVHRRFSDTTLDLYGDGELMPLVKKLIEEKSLQDSVVLHGKASRNEIAEGLNQSDCFVLLSERETFGVVYIEALAAGVPVVATICHGPEDFVTAQFGKLIPANDLESAIDAMCYMHDNIDRFDKYGISKTIKDMYSGKVIAEQIMKVYSSILE